MKIEDNKVIDQYGAVKILINKERFLNENRR